MPEEEDETIPGLILLCGLRKLSIESGQDRQEEDSATIEK